MTENNNKLTIDDLITITQMQGWNNANVPGHVFQDPGIFRYLPILQPTTTEVGISYLAYIRFDASMEYLGQPVLRPKHNNREGFLENDPEWFTKGQTKYRDGIVPKFLHEDLKSGKCEKVIMDYSVEGFHEVEWDFISDLFGIKKDKIIWLTSIVNAELLNAESEVTVLYHNHWEQFVAQLPFKLTDAEQKEFQKQIKQQLQDIDNLKIRKYHGLNYNRRPHTHRVYLLSKLKSLNLIEQTSYSWGGFINEGLTLDHYSEWSTNVDKAWQLAAERGDFLGGNKDWDALNWVLDHPKKSFPNEDLNINKADSINFDHVKDCYFQIVSETFALHPEPHVFLSEKAFKPFVCGMPFVMWGTKGSVETLQKMGYRTFNKWINHGYDSCDNSATRFGMLTKEIERLYAISPEEWSIMLKEMLPDIIHNINKIVTKGYGNIPKLPLIVTGFNPKPWRFDIDLGGTIVYLDMNKVIEKD